ncbi:condensation domain-containing protein, partial [Streptomyces sp. NPDC006274]|uniref:condensation domain-containing protein n=1 Tax=unclassified Streptomyces TaxID=2593676 RepID=UPI0033B5295E
MTLGGHGIPLTAAQSGIWFAQQLDAENPVYNAGEYLEIHGALDRGLFEAALRRVVDEMDNLRARFTETPDGPRQVIEQDLRWELLTVDVSAEADPRAAAEAWMRADMARPQDTSAGPLFLFVLFRAADDRWFWLHRYHHLLVDGFTVALVARRTAEIYTALTTGEESPNPFGPLDELVRQDAAYRESERFTTDRDYWLRRLADRPEPVSLSAKEPSAARGLLRRTARLDAGVAEKLREASREAGVPWPCLVTAVVAVYLHRLTGAEEVVLGLPVTTRLGGAARSLPGMVSNVLPLRVPVAGHSTLEDVLTQVAREMRGAMKHQRYRYEDLRRDLQLLGADRRLTGPQVNIMMFDYDLRFGELPATVHNLCIGPADDLSVIVYDRTDGKGLQIDFDANPDLYTGAELDAHLARFRAFLTALADAPADLPLGRVDVLTGEERALVAPAAAAPAEQSPATLVEVFEDQVARTPDAVALSYGDVSLTYQELNERSNRLARLLRARGVAPEQYVAIALPRGADLIVGLLAVVKSGAAYVPMDPDYPADRLSYMVADAHPVVVITDSSADLSAVDTAGVPRLVLDLPEVVAELAALDGDDLGVDIASSHPAYVIYTSGSTGRPKGVVVPHSNVVRLFTST